MLVRSLVILSISVSVFGTNPVNTTIWGVAVKGYDTVAYFQLHKAVKGNKSFQYEWNGAKWYFSSQTHLDQFKKSPQEFAPQFGGYCAWAVSQGYTANIDPKAWKIVDGKLYLNYDHDVQAKWELDMVNLIAQALTNWPAIVAK